MDYKDFIESKRITVWVSWFDISKDDLHSKLFEYQKTIVQMALKKWRYAIFADCWLWKTFMQLEFAKQVNIKTWKPVLLLTPLAVWRQTLKEASTFWYDAKIISDRQWVENKINIINYDKLHKIQWLDWGWVILDESSILKSFDWKTRNLLIEEYKYTPYKLCCTATPSPNDFTELWNHSEFLNVLDVDTMLSVFFINDASHWNGRRLKKHAEDEFWEFVWSRWVMIRRPCDLWDDRWYLLPKLNIIPVVVKVENDSDQLFVAPAQWLNEVRNARKQSIPQRIEKLNEIYEKHEWQLLVWCDYNYESKEIMNAIPDAMEVEGATKSKIKEDIMLWFSDWSVKTLVTKPKIAGFWMNWQSCNTMVFFGISHSYEQYYQAIRRCWRYWQNNDVTVYIIIWEAEQSVLDSVIEKSKKHDLQYEWMSQNVLKSFYSNHKKINMNTWETLKTDKYTLMQWDCVQRTKEIADNSIDYSIFSPPFSDLFTYSDSEFDMWNSKDDDEFYNHFGYLIDDLFRITKPWRLVSFHCMNLPTRKWKDWFIGIKDFRWDLIREFQKRWFYYHSEVCIWKDPVVAMQRTKAVWLLHKTIKKDSSMSRQWIADYVVTMRKRWDNEEPIQHTAEEYPVDYRQRIASPIRTDINQSDTLQYRSARDHKDEKHICPLQLEVIRRCIYLWTNKWDTVFSPFTWIWSEWYVSLELGRKFIWVELKNSYYEQAKRNLMNVTKIKKLF